MPFLAWHAAFISPIFLEESFVFDILFFSSISFQCPFKKAFLFLLDILRNFVFRWLYLSFFPSLSFLFFLQLFVKSTQTITFPSCICFSLGWSWSPLSAQCYKALSIVLQALCLPDLIPWIYFSLPLYNHKGFDLDHTWMVYWFSLLFNLSLNLAIRSSWSESQSAPSLIFADCVELLHLQLQRI